MSTHRCLNHLCLATPGPPESRAPKTEHRFLGSRSRRAFVRSADQWELPVQSGKQSLPEQRVTMSGGVVWG